MQKQNIIEQMRKNKPNFNQQDVINKQYDYLKYEDNMGERTILFFLSNKKQCTKIKLMSDYSYLDQTIDSLNEHYQKIKKHKWKYTRNGEDYVIQLKQKKWYFTLVSQKRKVK